MSMTIMDILRNNVLAQTAYTPEAARLMQNMSVGTAPMEDGMGGYGGGMNITMNPSFISKGNQSEAADIFRHEGLHNLDRALYDSSEMGLNPITSSRGVSGIQGLLNIAQNKFPRLRNIPNKDVETFAYAGSDPRNVTGISQYNPVYRPATMPLPDYSPIFQTAETQQRIADRFRGSGWVKGKTL